MASAMTADALASYSVHTEMPEETMPSDGLEMVMDLFGELVWLAIGFAIIRFLVQIKVLPEIRVGFLSPKAQRSQKHRLLHAVAADVCGEPEEAAAKQAKPQLGATQRIASATVATPAARAHAVAIRDLLRAGRAIEALRRMVGMREAGLEVPSRAVAELLMVALAEGPEAAKEVIEELYVDSVGKVPMDGIAAAVAECLRHDDVASARCLEQLARGQPAPVQYSVYEPLVKIYAKADQTQASGLFREMHERGFFASEGLCGCLMARSGEAQHIAFAEEVAEHLRSRSMMTLATYRTLMKVYASNGMHDRACDLYEEIIAQGVEPDTVMYGCLMKFATKCGRSALAQELLAKSKGGGSHNHMSLMRAAARDGDVASAMDVLSKAESMQAASGKTAGTTDSAVYNCALDICVTAGRVTEAEELLTHVVSKGVATRVTYNTLMKGYCSKGDISSARKVLKDMAAAGVFPDCASYNCLLGALGTESCETIFETLHEMERQGLPADHYTVSIMMKVAKKARSPRDAARALAVLDHASVSVCDDEVLLNTVLDACIARRDTDRLARVARDFDSSNFQPSVHTYGLLIKAFGMLRQLQRCQALWAEMVEKRTLVPTGIALSCMLDAYCCASRVEEAVILLREWKGRVPANTIMFSTLIKGFASMGNSRRAADMCDELRTEGLSMNLVAYTALLDAHARVGEMQQASAIFQNMQDDGCEPNIITYSALVKGHCLQGELGEASKLFRKMLCNGIRPDAVIFNTLLDGCVRHAHYELAEQLLAEMEGQRIEPTNFTVSIIVKLWGKRRKLDKAFDVVRRRARRSGGGASGGRHCLDAQVGACLVSACFLNQAPEKALQALAEIKSWPGCAEPDLTIYSALVGGLARHGECRKAADIASEACEAIILRRHGSKEKKLSAESLQLLFKGLHQQSLYQELGLPLMQKLRLARVPLPEESASSIDSATSLGKTKATAGAASSANRGSLTGECLRLEPSWRRH